MKKVFPTAFTILNLLSGFFGISLLLSNNYSIIEYCIYFSLLFDALDGYFARKLNVVSNFGKHLDSFSDLISFITSNIPSQSRWKYNVLKLRIDYLLDQASIAQIQNLPILGSR